MGGKGGGGGNNMPRPPGQQATGQDPFAGGGKRQPPPQRQQSPAPSSPRSRPMPTERDRLRIGEDKLQGLYAPSKKPSPLTPLPARVGVRQERRPFPDPNLKFTDAELNAGGIVDPRLKFSEKELNNLYGGGDGGTGSLLSEGEDYDSITGEVF